MQGAFNLLFGCLRGNVLLKYLVSCPATVSKLPQLNHVLDWQLKVTHLPFSALARPHVPQMIRSDSTK